jgi:hypothetical protein
MICEWQSVGSILTPHSVRQLLFVRSAQAVESMLVNTLLDAASWQDASGNDSEDRRMWPPTSCDRMSLSHVIFDHGPVMQETRAATLK